MQSHGRADESRWKRAVYKGWMVKVVGLKLVTHQPVIEPVSAPAPGTEISYAETARKIRFFA
jgi:hypothetical protein